MSALDIKRLCQRWSKVQTTRQNWESLWDDCYRLAMPARASFFSHTRGEELTEDIFDSTAVTGVQEFANRMQDAITPNFAPWFVLVPGSEIRTVDRPSVQKDLDQVSHYVASTIQRSNFAQQIHEIYQDLAIGTGALSVEPDNEDLIRFHAAPMPTVYLDKAPNGQIDGVFRAHKTLSAYDISIRWPNAVMPPDMENAIASKQDSEEKPLIVEANYRDWNEKGQEVYYWQLFMPEKKVLLEEQVDRGQGSKTWITPRWSVATGEVYGRGQLVQALPDVKTLNLVVQMILENAELAIAGLWQADDSGVVPADQIQIIPGTIIPRRPNSRGLEPLGPATQFDIGQITVERLQDNIRLALFNQRLGSLQRTPRSATEIIERQADLAKLIGAAFGRLQIELAEPVIARVVNILKKQGRIELPRINGREIAISSKSPLARAQRLDEVQNIQNFVGLANQLFGPQVASLKINADEALNKMAQFMEVPPELVNDEAQQQRMIQQLGEIGGVMAGDDSAVPPA